MHDETKRLYEVEGEQLKVLLVAEALPQQNEKVSEVVGAEFAHARLTTLGVLFLKFDAEASGVQWEDQEIEMVHHEM